MAQAILTINAGSSSLKFALYRIEECELPLVLHGAIENIGGLPSMIVCDPDGRVFTERRWEIPKAFEDLLAALMAWVEQQLAPDTLAAVGHRVVYGLPHHDGPERITPTLLSALAELTPLAPLHVPHNLAPIHLIAASHPHVVQVACFDTAFHHTMPAVATRFALPSEFTAAGVRRYGFHGLSYDYISRQLRSLAPTVAGGKVIACHLGSGASLCALRDGRSVETTMGFTALDGLVMSTRCGSIDPGVLLYMMQTLKMPAAEIESVLYRRSGLLGVSGGLSADMRDLLASGDPRAADAVDLFVHRIVREIGGLVSVLGGVDAIVFSAGIGEHSPPIRARIVAGLAWLGARIDATANLKGDIFIGSATSKVALMVVPTDEEAMIAVQTRDLLAPFLRTAPAGETCHA